MNDSIPEIAGQSLSEPLSEQQAKTLATVHGKPLSVLPKDLYIPPDALEIILEKFAGPLDLLLYLIKKHNLDILEIPIADIANQYIAYIDLMQNLRLELAAEYLLMAAMLAEIKSRMLLPRPVSETFDAEADPRAELIRRLQEYERFKKAADDLDAMPRLWRDTLPVAVEPPDGNINKPQPNVEISALLLAFEAVLARAKLLTHHSVERETLTVRQRMSHILQLINTDKFYEFTQLFVLAEGRLGIVVTFVAILELLKQAAIETVQAEPYGVIYVRAL